MATLERYPLGVVAACQLALMQPDLPVKTKADYTFLLGRGLHRSGGAAQAIKFYADALALDPGNAEIMVSRGWAANAVNDAKGAREIATEAIKTDVKNERAWHLRGYLLYEDDRAAEARESYTHALRLNPTFGAAWLHRAALSRDTGDVSGALNDLAELIKVPADKANLGGLLNGRGLPMSIHATAHAMRAQILTKLGRLAEAEADWNRMIELEPTGENLSDRAQFLFAHAGRPAEALRDIRAAQAKEPGSDASYRYWRTEIRMLVVNKQGDEALAEIDRRAKAEPGDYFFPMTRRDTLQNLGRVEEALTLTLQLFQQEPATSWDVVKRMKKRGLWKGEAEPKDLTPALKKAFVACHRDPGC